jgi:hypothetical protein
MIVTSIMFDYFKGYVTAFIDITGQAETIFAHPPVKKVRLIVNIVSAIEQLFTILLFLLIMIRVGTHAPEMLWGVVVPIEVFFAATGILNFILFAYFAFCLFRYTTELYWLIAYFFFLPIIFVDLCLFFGVPILISILMPIQQELKVWQSPTTWDYSAYIILWLVGGLFKGFVRGSDDPENPYSKEYPSVLLRFVYFLFFFLIAVFVFICSGRIDQKIPFTTDPFPAISYWIVFIPLFIAFAMLFVVFCFKGVIAWNLFLKGDENRDGPLLAMTYSTICIYLILNIITCILFSVRNDLPSVKQVNFSPALCLLPTAVGHVLLFVISICPFFPNFKKQITADDEEKQEYELLTFL